MLSFGHQDGGESPTGPWHPAASKATTSRGRGVVRAMTAAELQSDDPEQLAGRWSQVMELPLARDDRGRPAIALDDAKLRFVKAADGRSEGLAGLDLDCTDRAGVIARAQARRLPVEGDTVLACGIRFRLT
jgi:hypothetical protein